MDHPMRYQNVLDLIGFYKEQATRYNPTHLHPKYVLVILADLLTILKSKKSGTILYAMGRLIIGPCIGLLVRCRGVGRRTTITHDHS